MPYKRIAVNVFTLGALLLSALMLPERAQAKPPRPAGGNNSQAAAVTCSLPESNAEALEILSNYYPGYWWDHAHLTIAVQSAPNVDPGQLEAIHAAIDTWSTVLDDCFDGAITLTDVTGTLQNKRRGVDIILHYVPTAGGISFDGYAVCGANRCSNVMVKSDLPHDVQYSPEYVGWVTLHEIGHALGLGHTTNLWESTDLMGYGWPDLGEPVLSQCDIEGIAFVFAWVFEGGAPHPPAEGPFECS